MIENNFISESNERALIYCILKKEEYLLDVIEQLDLDSFISSCKNIYKVILDYFESGNKIIIEAVLAKLSQKDNDYLQTILTEFFNLDNFKVYLDIIKNKTLIRECKKISITINDKLTTGINGIEILDYLQEQTDLLSNNVSSSINLFGNNLFNIIPNPETYDPLQKREFLGIYSYIKELDRITLGFHNGCYTIIGGRPSSSKTLCVRQILINNALKGIPSIIFSLDEPEQIIKLKTVSTITGINYNHLKKQELNVQELNKLKSKIEIIKNLPLIIDTTPNLTTTIMRAKIKKAMYKFPLLGSIALDYVQQLGVTNEELSRVSQSIKNMCFEFNKPFFVISQLSRNIENRSTNNEEKWTEFPLLSDLRASGELEQGGDKIFIIKAEPLKGEDGIFKEKRKIRFFTMKQRDGEAGTYFDVYSIGNIQTLEEINNNQTLLNF